MIKKSEIQKEYEKKHRQKTNTQHKKFHEFDAAERKKEMRKINKAFKHEQSLLKSVKPTKEDLSSAYSHMEKHKG